MSCNINNNKVDLETLTQGDFAEYDRKTRVKFYSDFVDNKSFRNGKRISAGSTDKEIEECYSHLTTKGTMDNTRIPDLRRLECVYILKHLLTDLQCSSCENLYVWEKQEKYLKEKIFCPETGYLIILLKRKYVYKFVSAYFIGGENKKKRLIEEYRSCTYPTNKNMA